MGLFLRICTACSLCWPVAWCRLVNADLWCMKEEWGTGNRQATAISSCEWRWRFSTLISKIKVTNPQFKTYFFVQ
jgi:hypothetical protein